MAVVILGVAHQVHLPTLYLRVGQRGPAPGPSGATLSQ
jgi:hypothetical protein